MTKSFNNLNKNDEIILIKVKKMFSDELGFNLNSIDKAILMAINLTRLQEKTRWSLK